MADKHLIHTHSSVVTQGNPKLPSAERIEYGEIAVNFAEGYETLSVKNSSNEITTFSSDNTIYNKMNRQGKVIASALNDLNERISGAADDIGGQLDEVKDDIAEIDEITSAAMTELVSDVDYENDSTITTTSGSVKKNVTDAETIAYDGLSVKNVEDNLYIEKRDGWFPVSHPDVSTQPSLLPQRFGNINMYEVASRIKMNNGNMELVDVPSNVKIVLADAFNDSQYMTFPVQKAGDKWKLVSPTFTPDWCIVKYIGEDKGYYYYASGGGDSTIKPNIPLVVKYTTTSANQQVKLCNANATNTFSKIEVDGTSLSPSTLDSNSRNYTFATAGEHTVKYTLINDTSIGNYAFGGCSGLTSVTIPNSVTSIGGSAFNYCTGLTSVTIPNSVTSIGDDAFRVCTGLTSITCLAATAPTIQSNTFYNVKTGGTLYVPSGSTGYDAWMSSGDYYLGKYNWSKTDIDTLVTTYRTTGNGQTVKLFLEDNGHAGIVAANTFSKVDIDGIEVSPSDLDTAEGMFTFATTGEHIVIYTLIDNTSIGNYVFSGCAGLTSITIPNSVTSIGGNAFSDCVGLTSVTIPSSVTSIGNNPFDGCSGLTSITVDSGNQTYDSRDNCNAIIQTSTNTLVSGCKNTVIPNSVTSIGSYAFRGCTGLTYLTIPDSVTSIGYGAFRGCTGLTYLTIPDSVTSIGYDAFSYCSDLTSIICLATTAPTIRSDTFQNVASNGLLTVPAGSTGYGTWMGSGDYYLGKYGWLMNEFEPRLVMKYTTTSANEEVKLCHAAAASTFSKIEVDGTSLSPSTLDSNNKKYTFATAGEHTVKYTLIDDTIINSGYFQECDSLTSVTIPNSVTSIGDGAFAGCSGLTSATIPNSVISIGNGIFDSCIGLISITCLATTAPTIQTYTFYNVNTGGTLYVPSGSTGYDAWMSSGNFYLGKYGWNKVEIEFVDLGLPSGTIWATKNVGASSITDTGLYFQWGDTQGYTASQVGTGEGQKRFRWTDYKYGDGGSSASNMTKYNRTDGLTTLVPKDDAAHVNMGGNWMMPTQAQLSELWNNTDHSWVTNYNGSGVNGRLFTSRSDSSKTLFVPASGNRWDGNVNYVGSNGYYWSSDVYSSSLSNAWHMYFYSGGGGVYGGSRPLGFVVRGVWVESSSSSE